MKLGGYAVVMCNPPKCLFNQLRFKNNSFLSEQDLAMCKKEYLFITTFTTIH